MQTRWSKKDLTGRLIADQAKDTMADQWEVVEFPAILPSEKPLWPEFWNTEELLKVKASLSIGKWNAQWQQNQLVKKWQWSSVIGGSYGSERTHRDLTILFKVTIRHILKKRLPTIVL